MTYEEAEICLKYHFPVKLVAAPDLYTENMVGNVYYINMVSRFIPYGNNGKEIEASATLEMNSKSWTSVDLCKIELLNSFKNTVHNYLKNRKKAQFRALINEYVEAGLTQTRIIDKVKSIIKDIKTKEKTENG